MTTNRLEKVNSLLLHEIGQIILRDFDFVGSLVTLTRIETSANLIDTKAFVTVLPEDKMDFIVKTLNNNVRDIQEQINRKLNMRPVPKIKFVKDENIAKAAKIEALLNKIKPEIEA